MHLPEEPLLHGSAEASHLPLELDICRVFADVGDPELGVSPDARSGGVMLAAGCDRRRRAVAGLLGVVRHG